MDGSKSLGLMALLTSKIAYLNQMQGVLAENVANADTPGFKARDLTPFTFDSALKQASFEMVTDDPRHITPASMSGVNAKSTKVKTNETLPSGNSVDLEQEMMKVSQNSVDYQTVTSIYKSIGQWFNIALKGTNT
jgi:flagellar basal-body rod protein FlgB